jgi:divalent metal cation (Fe/Co/Zn/Cd) transporter
MNAVGADYDLPPQLHKCLHRATRLVWISIVFMISIIVLMFMVMGSSEAMKAMWVEDTLSLVPLISFLIGVHYRRKPPDEAFPYGYRRAVLVGFLCGAMALSSFGVYMLADSLTTLIKAEHASIPSIEIAGRVIWMGWLMLAVLLYSVIPPVVLGRMKLPLAAALHDKVLHVSATVDKGDWLSGLAGVAGITGIAFGLWWADGAAAAIISFEIIKDGYENLRNSIAQLMNKRPTDIETQQKDRVVDEVENALVRLDWVAEARVRLREDGDVISGEAYIVPRDHDRLIERLEDARKAAVAVDWRLHDLNMVPVRRFN